MSKVIDRAKLISELKRFVKFNREEARNFLNIGMNNNYAQYSNYADIYQTFLENVKRGDYDRK